MAQAIHTAETATVYGELLSRLRHQIVEGRLANGQLLPSENVLSRQYGISRWAVREATDILAKEGLVRRFPGKGTMVLPHQPDRRGRVSVSLLIDNTTKIDVNDYSAEFLRRIQAHSAAMRRPVELDYHIIELTAGERENDAIIRQTDADAVVVMPFSRQCQDYMESIAVLDRPIFCLGAQIVSSVVPQIFIDDVEGTRKGARYLLQIGHRKIAMIAPDGYRHDTDYSRIRQETFIDVMRRADCQWTWPLTEVTPCAYAPIRAAVKRWLGAADQPTAFFVADGNWVSPVRAALEVLGKRVPQDISLLTYDDVLDAQVAEPPITAVRQPIDRAARRLLEVILDHLEKSPKAALMNRVAPELVVRESCQPPGWKYAI